MRKTFVIGTVIVSLFAFAPSHAKTRTVSKKSIVFNAPVACTTLCAHNLDGLSSEFTGFAGEADPTDTAVSTCGDPFPTGGYADHVVKAPKGANTLVFTIRPQVDWDSYICSVPAKGKKSQVLGSGANTVGADCLHGCVETISIRVRPGRSYILRAYNWSDPAPCPAQYRFLSIT
jgi:hypothetical protein